MDTAYGLSFRQWAEICGTSGHLEINDFCIARYVSLHMPGARTGDTCQGYPSPGTLVPY